jgi:hypothetical protein
MQKLKNNKYWLTSIALAIIFIVNWGAQKVGSLMLWGVISSIVVTIFFVLIFVNISKKQKVAQTVGSWMIVSIAAVGSFIIGSIGGVVNAIDDSDKKHDSNNFHVSAFEDTAKTKNFEITPISISRQKTIGSGYLKSTAEGEYVIFKVKVKNISGKSQNMVGADRVLYDQDSNKHESGSFDEYLYKDNRSRDNIIPEKSLTDELNPGMERVGYIVFDVPAGLSYSKVAISDDMWKNDNEHTAVFDLKNRQF